MVAPGIEEVEPAAGEDAGAGFLQRVAGSFEVVDDEPDVPVRVGLLRPACRQRYELVDDKLMVRRESNVDYWDREVD